MSAPIKKLWKKWVAQCVKISFLIPLVDSLTLIFQASLSCGIFHGRLCTLKILSQHKTTGKQCCPLSKYNIPFYSHLNYKLCQFFYHHARKVHKQADWFISMTFMSLKFYWASWVLSSGQADRLASPRTAAEPVGLHLRYQELVTLK